MLGVPRFLIYLVISPIFLQGQSPVVPTQFYFGDIRIRLGDKVREEIQQDVNALTGSPKYFQTKVDRADLYLPMIERILQEENVPDDFKYLCIQESALIPDAVSSSNAVGFWQFKKPTALEVGLRVDSRVDERMNIISSTRAASTYLKNSYSVFDNWIYALLSYNTGLTGAQKWVHERHFGSKKMEIPKNSHWYVKKFLAHKFAYEYAVGRNPNPAMTLVEYTRGANKDLKTIARETSINYDELRNYNKWLRRDPVPADKSYTVMLPIPNGRSKELATQSQPIRPEIVIDDKKGNRYPVIQGSLKMDEPYIVRINGLSGLLGKENDQLSDLVQRGLVPEKRLIKYNDLSAPISIEPGQVYYLESKRGRARLYFHTASPDETLWGVSQKFGMKLKKLRKFNRMRKSEDVQPGRVLWLGKPRPKNTDIEYRTDLVKSYAVGKVASSSVVGKSKPVPNTRPVVSPSGQRGQSNSSSNALRNRALSNQEAKEGTRFHLVKQGETLYSISRLYGLSTSEIILLNDIGPGEIISIGQELVVPTKSENEVEGRSKVRFHEVAIGDNLFQIARKYGTSVEELMKWNNKSEDSIQLGEKLVVVSPE